MGGCSSHRDVSLRCTPRWFCLSAFRLFFASNDGCCDMTPFVLRSLPRPFCLPSPSVIPSEAQAICALSSLVPNSLGKGVKRADGAYMDEIRSNRTLSSLGMTRLHRRSGGISSPRRTPSLSRGSPQNAEPKANVLWGRLPLGAIHAHAPR